MLPFERLNVYLTLTCTRMFSRAGICLAAACMLYSNVRLLLTARRCGRWIEGIKPPQTTLCFVGGEIGLE
eukprot:COSAG03_NODE_225_length_10336_cov_715.603888_6_plen_70_part_00